MADGEVVPLRPKVEIVAPDPVQVQLDALAARLAALELTVSRALATGTELGAD